MSCERASWGWRAGLSPPILGILLVCLPAWTTPRAAAAELPAFKAEVRPLLEQYCLKCHGLGKQLQADINLSVFADERSVLASRALWKQVLDALHGQSMPPEDQPQPTPAERDRLTDWIEGMLAQPDPDGRRDPGHVVVRRLNRVEYNRTILDLFRMQRSTKKYYDPSLPTLTGPLEQVTTHPNRRVFLIDLPPDDADYGFDNIGEVLTLPPFLMEKYIAAAKKVVELNDGTQSKFRSWIFSAPPPSRKPADFYRGQLRSLARRAFRRPVTDDDMALLWKLYDESFAQTGDAMTAMYLPVQAILISPEFLFRIEGHPGEVPDQIVPVSDHELAVRLSYFLWSTLPDDQLFGLAERGELHKPEVLQEQVRRMLRDRKSQALAENFAMQWLQIEGIEAAAPDPDIFPLFGTQNGHLLLRYMKDEARLLFEAVLIEDRSVLDFLDADFTFANEPLAQHYGIYRPELHASALSSRDFVRYPLEDPRRGGVLNLGAVLLCTSQSNRTSPVKRGKWVLEKVLGAPPPPPLANVTDLDSAGPESDKLPLRERLALHRSNPNCASCHSRMDPFGLALENYNAVGAWREKDAGVTIDASTQLAKGPMVNGPVELKQYISEHRRDDFVRTLVEHMLTYALGRKLEYYDTPTVAHISQQLAQNEYRFSTLILAIVESYPFQYRRTEETPHVP